MENLIIVSSSSGDFKSIIGFNELHGNVNPITFCLMAKNNSQTHTHTIHSTKTKQKIEKYPIRPKFQCESNHSGRSKKNVSSYWQILKLHILKFNYYLDWHTNHKYQALSIRTIFRILLFPSTALNEVL